MRRWWILLPLALLVAAWFALRPGVTAAVAPAARPLEVELHDPELAVVDGAGAADTERSVVEDEREVPDPEAQSEPGELDESSPTAVLTVRAFLPDGTPWKHGQIRITARSSPLSTLRFASEVRTKIGGHVRIHSSGSSGHSVVTGTDDQGVLELHSVVPDLPLELSAIDVLGTVAVTATGIMLEPGEQRTIDLWTVRFPWPLSGRCVDEDGRPLAGAVVDVGNAGLETFGMSLGWNQTTDETGEFATLPLFAKRVHVRAVLADRIAAERRDVSVDGAAVELVLRRGRSLLVEAHDDAGERVENVWFRVYEPGGDGPLDVPSESSPEGCLFTALPKRPLELRWGGPCSLESTSIDADVERVQVRVQRTGTLAIEVGKLPGGVEVTYAVGVYCADGTTSVASPKSVLNTGHQQATWTLAPGRYLLQLLHLPKSAPEAWLPWGAPIEVDVRPGATTFERMGE